MRQDDSYMIDLLEDAHEAESFVLNLSYSQFEESVLHQNALVKVLESIGEASAHTSEDTKRIFPDLIWPDMIGLGNRIVDSYFEIDLDMVGEFVNEDVPPLIDQFEPMVPSEN